MNYKVVVQVATPDRLRGPLKFLRRGLGNGEPPPLGFPERLARAVEAGDLEVLVALRGGRIVGALMLAYRPNILLGGDFASIEELYVDQETRRRGVGRALLEAAEDRSEARGISYVEVQTDEEAATFYEALGFEPEREVRVLSRSSVTAM